MSSTSAELLEASESAALEDDFAELFAEAGGQEETPAPAAEKKPAAKPPAKAKPAETPEPSAAEPQDEGEEEETEQEEQPEVEGDETAEAQEEDDDDEDNLEGVRDKEKVQAMLDKRKSQRDKAREERDAAVAELEQMKAAYTAAPVLLQPTPDSPVSHLYKPDDLRDAESAWEAELRWCRDNLEGGTREVGGRAEEWTPDRVKRRMDQAMEVLRKHLPEREKYLQEFQADLKTVTGTFDFLHPSSPLAQEATAFGDAVLERAPGLARHPQHISLLALAYIGKAVQSGKYTPITTPEGKVKLVPVKTAQPTKGAAIPAAPRAAAKPLLRKPTTPPARRTDPNAERAARIAAAPTEEAAAMAELDELFD